MPLSAPALSALIVKEFGDLGSDSPETNAQYAEGTKKLADCIANAVVQAITTQAQVTIPAGIPVATAGSPAAQTGATTAPAIGTIS